MPTEPTVREHRVKGQRQLLAARLRFESTCLHMETRVLAHGVVEMRAMPCAS